MLPMLLLLLVPLLHLQSQLQLQLQLRPAAREKLRHSRWAHKRALGRLHLAAWRRPPPIDRGHGSQMTRRSLPTARRAGGRHDCRFGYLSELEAFCCGPT
jgi:hypothetical protein